MGEWPPLLKHLFVISAASLQLLASGSPQDYVAERQNLMERLLDAVKQVQLCGRAVGVCLLISDLFLLSSVRLGLVASRR